MKKANKKLSVTKQTVRDLSAHDAQQVNGGTLYQVAQYDMAPAEARPRCTYGFSGCTQSGR
jgi:hypothetical protein